MGLKKYTTPDHNIMSKVLLFVDIMQYFLAELNNLICDMYDMVLMNKYYQTMTLTGLID